MKQLRSLAKNKVLGNQPDFTPATCCIRLVDFDNHDSREDYREAQRWCAMNCVGKWRLEPDRLRRRATFQFELERDAVLFRLLSEDIL